MMASPAGPDKFLLQAVPPVRLTISSCRPDKFLLLDTKGAPECHNGGQDVCPSGTEPDMSHWQCMGRLSEGYRQLMPQRDSDGHKWVALAHSLGVVVHAWTVRNEVCASATSLGVSPLAAALTVVLSAPPRACM